MWWVVKIFVRNWSKEPESYENGEKFAAFSGIFAFSTFPPAAPEPTIVPGKTCRGASEKSTHMGLTVTKDIKTYKGTKSDHSVKYFRHHYRHHSLRGFLAVLLILLALTIRWFFEALAVSQDSFQQLAKKVFPRVKKNTTLWSSWNLLGLFSWHSWEHNQWECEQNSLQFRADPLTSQEQTIMRQKGIMANLSLMENIPFDSVSNNSSGKMN